MRRIVRQGAVVFSSIDFSLCAFSPCEHARAQAEESVWQITVQHAGGKSRIDYAGLMSRLKL